MAKAYHFSDETPVLGSIIHAFRELEDLKEFTRIQGGNEIQKIWEIEGDLDSDDEPKGGIQIRVFEVTEFF